MMQRRKRGTGLFMLLALAVLPLSRAQGGPNGQVEQCPKNTRRVVVERSGQVIPLDLPAGESVLVVFPEAITNAHPVPAGDVGVLGVGKRLLVQAEPKSPLGAETTVDVTAGSMTVRLVFRKVDTPPNLLNTSVYLEPAVPAVPSAPATPTTLQTQNTTYQIDNSLPDWSSEWDRRVLSPGKMSKLEGALSVTVISGVWRGSELRVYAELTSRVTRPYWITELEVTLGPGLTKHSARVRWLPPALVFEDRTVMIEAGKRVPIVIALPEAGKPGNEIAPLTLSLVGDDAQASSARVDYWVMDPATKEEFEDAKRDAEYRRQDRDSRGRVWVLPLGMAGIIGLANPADARDVGYTTMLGAGVRVEYGFARYLSVWGEGLGGRSSAKDFGDITRQATIGRLHIGGVVKIGYEKIVFLRAGLGTQGVSSKIVGGEDGSDFEMNGFFSAGLGVAARLGPLQVGAELMSCLFTDSGDARTFEFIIHAGGSWKPDGP